MRRADEEQVAHDLVDEERVPVGLVGERVRVDGSSGAIRSTSRAASARASSLPRRASSIVRTSPGQRSCVRVDVARRRLGRCRLVAHRRDEQERGLVRRAEDLGEEREAVGVGPLQVVDDDDERARVGDPREQLAQRGERARAELVRVERSRSSGARSLGDRLDAPEHREDLHERPGRVGRKRSHRRVAGAARGSARARR